MRTKKEIADFFGVSKERISEQYEKNAQGLEAMHKKALATGKKVNGYTAEQLEQMTLKYWALAVK